MTESNSMSCCNSCKNKCVTRIYSHLNDADAPFAMGYVPWQQWENTYGLCKALQVGTIFPCLHKPFCGKGGKCR